ncbi:hypothetical protein AOL_s00004g428 [Orbilia oligospora ATCC 24927]|uniref:SMP domain-containing protein n=2 Tax=Orbilia oligospora TaxID=2813651 RepID=G1WYR7_ARTOA|nr:hypothetical protein AOL_s00004g428 [Orbilia oligospora ATCC 24927]EGX53769.1 hypothetical protein AOL_s00004g428 [Orbilia oligospora ATCC 24927]KAF3278233.1 hypothetical protein TWF970_004683 [Orbilia oligospora]
MSERLPTNDEITKQAAKGILFTPEQVQNIAKKELEISGPGIAAGGPAATAQSFYDKQQNFLEEATKLVDKPAAAISKEQASHIMSLETKALAGQRPAKGSLSSTLQSIADHNLTESTTDNKEAEAFVTKGDAAKAMHDEAVAHGGTVAKGSNASQLQSIADKTEHLKHTLAESLLKEARE